MSDQSNEQLFTKRDIIETITQVMGEERGEPYMGHEVGSPLTFLPSAIDVLYKECEVVKSKDVPQFDRHGHRSVPVPAFSKKYAIDIIEALPSYGQRLPRGNKYKQHYPSKEILEKVKQRFSAHREVVRT